MTSALVEGAPAGVHHLSDDVLDALSADLSRMDPQADVWVSLDCAECGHEWSSPFDVTEYLWAELDAYTRRLLRDVHALAAAYGWSEDQVLAVGPMRRQCYLELVGDD